MNLSVYLLLLTVFFNLQLYSQNKIKTDSIQKLQEVHIKSTRANNRFLSTYTALSSKEIESLNLAQDVPYILQSTPSLSYSSDAGNAVGYTNLSIRGSDAQRIQVNINGVPYNDPESHEVYWVNIPDLMGSTDDIQIQRGVGFSTTGGTSFGGLISIKTTKKYVKPMGSISTSIGSFNTLKTSVQGTTGILPDGWQATARASYISSNGYIDRASSKLQSIYFGLSHYSEKLNTHFIAFTGNERTYQAWYGVSHEDISKGNLTKNIAGTDYEQKIGAPYPNQIDNYTQSNIQWITNYMWNPNVHSSFTAYLTKGKGYYEEYKVGANYSYYNLNSTLNGDIVRQLWLDNYLIGANASTSIQRSNWENTTSLSFNSSMGGHYGKVAHIIDVPSLYINEPFYNSDARKYDFTIFNKWAYSLSKTTFVIDLQIRNVNYSEKGPSINAPIEFEKHFLFFNPKIGVNTQLNLSDKLYFFAGIGQKEPNRNDIIDTKNPTSETNLNLELGHIMSKKKWNLETNLYAMLYQNQLILTGNVNDVGASIRENVAKSYRAGMEMSFNTSISKKLKFSTNQSLSIHKILDYTYTIPTYNEDYSLNSNLSTRQFFPSTTIAMSPSWISFLELEFNPYKNFILKIINKTTSKQYLDNTSDPLKSIPTYSYINIVSEYTLKTLWAKELKFNLILNNVLDTKVNTRGYTYNSGNSMSSSGAFSKGQDYNYYFPQAGFNFMMGMKVGF